MIGVEEIMAARTDARTPHEVGMSEIDETYGATAKKDVNSTAVTQNISSFRSFGGRKKDIQAQRHRSHSITGKHDLARPVIAMYYE